MKISVAHPTRRPVKALAIRKLWLESAADPSRIEWIFGIDDDDAESVRLLSSEPHTVSPAGGGCARACNDAAAKTTGQVIVCACDDVYPPEKWDDQILARLGDASQPASLLTSDGYRRDRLATLTIITRPLYERQGYVYPPQFRSMGADMWQTERAYRDGIMIDASDIVFEHRHPFYKKAEMDDVYAVQNSEERKREAARLVGELLEPLKISLCMIVGNEEATIERCLSSAKPVIDELCIVRAVGNQTPDGTLEKVRVWSAINGVPLRFKEYQNRIPMPHVDNFAAARNLSFELATNHWCLWLDADDVLDETTCVKIREASANSRFEAHMFRYVTPVGGNFFRERLIKRGKGIWRGAVHEECLILGDACRVPEIEITHAPPEGKASSGRNLAILDSVSADMPRYWFYRHEELLQLGKLEEALACGHSALAVLPSAMQAERYEVCMNMAELQEDRTDHWMFEALKIDPTRREALSQLVQFELKRGDNERAIQFFKWMDSIKTPSVKPWTHRPIWYGWGRDYLRVKILRAIGKTDEAAKEHAENMKREDYAKGVADYEPNI